MKSLLAILFLAVVLVGAWWLFFREVPGGATTSTTTTDSVKMSKHTSQFNAQVSQAVDAYLKMKDAFVDADTAAVKNDARNFISAVDSISLTEIESQDQQLGLAVHQNISDIEANTNSLLQQSDITEMRQDFRMVSENMYPFLKTIGYEGEKLYWQNCPMAFGEDQEANWISNSLEIVNPYLGKNHPEYKSSMLHCGEVKDTIK